MLDSCVRSLNPEAVSKLCMLRQCCINPANWFEPFFVRWADKTPPPRRGQVNRVSNETLYGP
jgi:hypothetical protein